MTRREWLDGTDEQVLDTMLDAWRAESPPLATERRIARALRGATAASLAAAALTTTAESKAAAASSLSAAALGSGSSTAAALASGTLLGITKWGGAGVVSGVLFAVTAGGIAQLPASAPAAPASALATVAPRAPNAERLPRRSPSPGASDKAPASLPASPPSVPGALPRASTTRARVAAVELEHTPALASPQPQASTAAFPIEPREPERLEIAAASRLQDEVTALDGARSALRHNDAARALSILDAYERTHPRGMLLREARAVRIEALMAAGRVAEARERTVVFLRDVSDGPLADRVRRLVEPLPGIEGGGRPPATP